MMNETAKGKNEKVNNAKRKEKRSACSAELLFVVCVISVRIRYMRFIRAEFIHGE